MAVTTSAPAPASARRPRLFWSRLHFLIRLLGVTGALFACLGAFLASIQGKLNQPLSDAATAWDHYTGALNMAGSAGEKFTQTGSFITQLWDIVANLGRISLEQPREQIATIFLLAGAAATLFALLVEVFVVLCFTATRRSAFGVNALVQVALAAVVLIALNAWSFSNYLQIDCTRDRQYTLPADVRNDLAQLDPSSQTTIIVYNRHKVFGLLSDNKLQDEYDSAAENKVVDKVRDLVEQFRAIGPRIKVEMLDTQSRDYKYKERLQEVIDAIVKGSNSAGESRHDEKRLKKWADEAASLRKTIEDAPENSLFFCARGENDKLYVQRLSFNDFYLLDKTASQDDRDGRGNLVLLYQGVEPVARRLLHLEERRPRVGIAVIHPVLSSMRDHDWGLRGLRQALEKRGFEVKDIVLKKWSQFAPPAAAAATVDESALERLDERERAMENTIRNLERAQPALKKGFEEFQKAITDENKRDELSKRYADQLDGGKLTVQDVQAQAMVLRLNLENLELALPSYRQRLKDVQDEKSKLNVPALREQQRMTDVQAKLSRLLDDCDVLIVPRMTLRNVADRFENVPGRLYNLDEPQVEAIKDFLKAGKPLLACFGPSNTPPDDRSMRPGDDQPDGLEKLLGELGIQFGKQTVLFFNEEDGLAEARADADLGGGQLEPPPPVLFDWQPGVGRPLGRRPVSDQPNRIRRSLQLDARALGRDADGKPIPLDIRIRHPRPLYYTPPKGSKLPYDPDFLMTDARSWDEEKPFPTGDYTPHFDRNKSKPGPFPIGVALDAELPASWYASTGQTPPTVRVAAIGQGGFFTGKKLEPADAKLFVDILNWLLGRDEQLPVANRVWSYPRVNDTVPPGSETYALWKYGVGFGLPALFFYLGGVVWLMRRVR
ncbi:MAG TPA: hypothetical protein VE999_02460 [Gemmataceae bacterium]|nr:hypothetical protein [Gemmataceae bacterium]